MAVDETYNDDTPIFAYNSLQVPTKTLFDQTVVFTLYPREGVDLRPITSTEDIPPDIQGLKKCFTLRTPRWIEQHGKGVKKKVDRVEVESPKPKRVLSSQVL